MREVSVGQGSCTGENAKIKVSAFVNFEDRPFEEEEENDHKEICNL